MGSRQDRAITLRRPGTPSRARSLHPRPQPPECSRPAASSQGTLPRAVHSMTKSTQFRQGLFRWILPRLYAFPVRRYRVDAQSVRVLLRRLEEGRVVCVYHGRRKVLGRATSTVTTRYPARNTASGRTGGSRRYRWNVPRLAPLGAEAQTRVLRPRSDWENRCELVNTWIGRRGKRPFQLSNNG